MLNLKPATENDFKTIEQLASDIWSKHYTPIIGAGQVNYMLRTLYSAVALKKQVDQGQIFHIWENEGQQAGFISVSTQDHKNYFLHKFYIHQEKQNTGLGTTIFKKIFGELYHADSIKLTVNRQNHKSINFYFKLGFKIDKVEDFDIGNGYYMNDFVMSWKKH